MKLIGTHQLIFYNDYVNVLGANIHTIKENTEASVFVNNEIGLELNDKKTKYVVMSRDQHAVCGHVLRPACSMWSCLETSMQYVVMSRDQHAVCGHVSRYIYI